MGFAEVNKQSPLFYKLVVVVLAEHVLFILKFFVGIWIPDQPRTVTKGVVYQEWREDKLWMEAGSYENWKLTTEEIDVVEEHFNTDDENEYANRLANEQSEARRQRQKEKK